MRGAICVICVILRHLRLTAPTLSHKPQIDAEKRRWIACLQWRFRRGQLMSGTIGNPGGIWCRIAPLSPITFQLAHREKTCSTASSDSAQREYVITRPDTPLPWINYLGCEAYFGLISNTAGGYSFFKDARLRRLTRYRYNNVPLDTGGRYIYLRDDGRDVPPGSASTGRRRGSLPAR